MYDRALRRMRARHNHTRVGHRWPDRRGYRWPFGIFDEEHWSAVSHRGERWPGWWRLSRLSEDYRNLL